MSLQRTWEMGSCKMGRCRPSFTVSSHFPATPHLFKPLPSYSPFLISPHFPQSFAIQVPHWVSWSGWRIVPVRFGTTFTKPVWETGLLVRGLKSGPSAAKRFAGDDSCASKGWVNGHLLRHANRHGAQHALDHGCSDRVPACQALLLPHRRRMSNAGNFRPEPQTSVYSRKYRPVHLLSFTAIPLTALRTAGDCLAHGTGSTLHEQPEGQSAWQGSTPPMCHAW